MDGQERTNRIADENYLQKLRIKTKVFTLTSYYRMKEYEAPLTIYIEGDGRAWLTHSKISSDPTPAHPMLIELAMLDKDPNIAYLARPCQFDGSASEAPCQDEYWANKRFSEEVIASMDEAVTSLKGRARASKVNLVGYSGGGAVAVLVASRRDDIASIRTIAGNLDPEGVNRRHGVPSLKGSLDPMAIASKLTLVPQRHFIGTKDNVVTPEISENFRKAVGGNCSQVTPVEGASHHSGWTDRWELLLKLPVSCS